MSEIHIGPHTRDEAAHDHGEPHHTFDREIDLKSIAKWMGGLLVLAVIIQILMWWLLRGLETADRRQDPELTPIETQVKQGPPPEPRLQVTSGFSRHNPDALSSSDLEDMQALRRQEDTVLSQPAWVDRTPGGRLRVPIDVAMQVIASRGAQGAQGTAPAGSVTPEQMRQELPAGTSTGAPGATVQMTRPPAPSDQAAPRPPDSQEQ